MNKRTLKLLSGFIRLHILHHAAEADICGNWMMEELREHGYALSPGTLYPMLSGMEADGWLRGRADPANPRRRLFRITAAGRRAMAEARERLTELFHEAGPSGAAAAMPEPRKRKSS